uniref:Replication protein A 70 kDa DNA-binding subunit B/D first OB fold domain-containing protein n=1 Tax=Brassica oleracea TaxID=3712 RepID=A0A3P6ALL9_BRAOL|nr:unnamed protein product [Brassica oleracea]
MANNMQLSFLNDLKHHKTAWRIQVKILHSWRFFMKGVGESMELILSNAHVRNKIHASRKKTYMADLAKHVSVVRGETLIISVFLVLGMVHIDQLVTNIAWLLFTALKYQSLPYMMTTCFLTLLILIQYKVVC